MVALLDLMEVARPTDLDETPSSSIPSWLSGWRVSGLLARGQWRYHQVSPEPVPKSSNGGARVRSIMKPRLILASASPRRRQLLAEAGYPFEIDPAGIEEPAPEPDTTPTAYAAQMAWRKAAEVARRRGSGLILASDTVSALRAEILNKPLDRVDAERMIRLQEGNDIEVISGVCLYRAERHEWVGAVEVSMVRFKPLCDRERTDYLDSGRWQGKSGAYGVQDQDPFVAVIRGSFSNVVGLPMERLASLLQSYPRLVAGRDSSIASDVARERAS
jgi:septum formation protein